MPRQWPSTIHELSVIASKLLRSFCLLVGLLTFTSTAFAQFRVEADLVSRYVWRGFDFGESFSLQPSVAYSKGGFTVGSWASYSIAADGAGANEHDLYLSYARGPIEVGLTDYFFPAPPGPNGVSETAEFFNYDNDGEGAHVLEPYVAFSGPETVPVQLSAAVNAYNEPDHSVYLEASYVFNADSGVDLGATAGFVPMESASYRTNGPNFVNLSLSASRAMEITDTFSVPVSVRYVLNPETERTFLVFGLSLGV